MRFCKRANTVSVFKGVGLGKHGERVKLEYVRIVPVYDFEEYSFGADDAVERDVVAHLTNRCLFEA